MILRRCAATLVAGWAIVAPGTLWASPLDDPHVGGVAFVGPTEGGLAAIYWNPAALGLVGGNQTMIATTTTLTRQTVDRSSIDPGTGTTGGTANPGSVAGSTTGHAFGWPPRSGGFVGVSTDFGGDRIALGVAAFSPFVEHGSFGAAADGRQPARYHRVETDLRNGALLAPALAIRLGDLRLGVSTRVVFSTARLIFDEDAAQARDGTDPGCSGAPCGAENPSAAARYQIDSGFGLGDASISYVVAGGLHYRRKAWDFGASFASRPLGSGVDGIRIGAGRSSVILPARDGGGPLPCPAWQPRDCVSADLTYGLPDVLTAGVAFRPTPRWQLAIFARYLTTSLHDRIDIRLTGPALAGAGLREHIVLHRGWRDVLDARSRAAFAVTPTVRIGAALRVQTSSVPAASLNPDAIDGLTIEPAAMIETRLRWLRLSAGYAFGWMLPVTGGTAFDPTAASRCRAAGGDLDDPDCRAERAGAARPSAAGRYGSSTHSFSLSLAAQF